MKNIVALLLGFIIMNTSVQTNTHPSIGKPAADFTLTDDTGAQWQLSKQHGNIVVLYFYPSDDTPGCTKQACSLRDNYDAFKKIGAVIVGINYDTQKTHTSFKEKHRLPFTLLSDPDKKVAKLYDAKNWWFLPWPLRKTIIIDATGTIRAIIPDVDVTTHTTDVLHAVEQLGKPSSDTSFKQ